MQKMKHEAKVKKLSALVCFSVLLVGCASAPEYVKNMKHEDLLYSNKIDADLRQDLNTIALNIGRDKSGFISPDSSNDRIIFEKTYPIAQHTATSYEKLTGRTYHHRVGQVLRLSADLDKRTSGFVKSENGMPVSVSGMIQINADPAISSAMAAGGSQVIATSVSSGSAINPAQGAGYNVGAGLGLGFIAGGIHALQADAAKSGIISKGDFGSRMEETTFSYAIPSAGRFYNDGWGNRGQQEPLVVAPGVVRMIYSIDGGKTIDYKDRIFLLSTVATYRGDLYRNAYPQTEGWEFRITNINVIEIPEVKYGEPRFRAIKKALVDKGITL